MNPWIRAELRHWRSWRPWAALLGLGVPVYFVTQLSAALGSAARMPVSDELKQLLSLLCVLAATVSWGMGFTAAHFARRFAMLAMPPLAVLAVSQLWLVSVHGIGMPGVAAAVSASAGFAVLSLLPGFLGWRMGWTGDKASCPVVMTLATVILATLLWARAGARAEWAGLALMLLCAWPVFHAVGVTWRLPAARR